MSSRTADYAGLIRCIVRDDWGEYDRMAERLTGEDAWDGWSEFLGAAFLVAVDRRFTPATEQADIIRFVAEARAEFTVSGDDFAPADAERLIGSVLGRAGASDVDTDTVVRVEIVLVRKLVRDAGLSDDELMAFLDEAAFTAAEWGSPQTE